MSARTNNKNIKTSRSESKMVSDYIIAHIEKKYVCLTCPTIITYTTEIKVEIT